MGPAVRPAPPAREDESTHTCCPRTQFLIAAGACTACGGLPLCAFIEADHSGAALHATPRE